jgi:hypothetical protein
MAIQNKHITRCKMKKTILVLSKDANKNYCEVKMSCKMKALENNGAMKQRHCNTMQCTKQTHCKKLQNKCKAFRHKQNNDIAKHKAKTNINWKTRVREIK